MKDLILDELAKNKSYYEELILTLKLEKNDLLYKQGHLFYDEIMDNYKSCLKSKLLKDLTQRLNLNAEQVWEVIEGIDLVGFFEC